MKMYLPWKIWKMDFPANHVGLLEGNLFDVGYTFCARFHFFPLKLVILSSIPCGFQSKRCNELVFFVHICIIYKYLNIYNIYIHMCWHRIWLVNVNIEIYIHSTSNGWVLANIHVPDIPYILCVYLYTESIFMLNVWHTQPRAYPLHTTWNHRVRTCQKITIIYIYRI